MMKSVKDYIQPLCVNEYGHLVILRLLDVVDDSVLLTKYVISVGVMAIILISIDNASKLGITGHG